MSRVGNVKPLHEGGLVVDWAYDGPMSLVARDIHNTAVDKGWWPEEGRQFGEVIANIHSEVDEAWKEYVHNHDLSETYYTVVDKKRTALIWDFEHGITDNEEWGGRTHQLLTALARWERFQRYLTHDSSQPANKPTEPERDEIKMLVRAGLLEPHGIPTELADIVIRCFDMMDAAGLDVDDVIQEKMLFNLTRAQRHGGKRA